MTHLQIPASKLRSQWRFNQPLIDEWLQSQSKGEGTRELNTKNQREKKFEKYGDSW